MTPDQAGLVFTDPTAYADEGRFHEGCAVLRREDPVHRVEADGFRPFYALTRHADVLDVETRHETWLNGPRPLLQPAEADDRRDAHGDLLRTLIHMDDPEHKAIRAITSDWFRPASLRKLGDRLAALARVWVDKMADLGGACDFCQDVAVHYPLYVILSILGLPESDFPRMLRLTQELFGAADPELRRGTTPEELEKVVADFFTYFTALTEDRRAHPTDDLASVIANATLNGQPIGLMECISYYVIVATAGHDTTSATTAGGMQALVERPDQLARLKADPSLMSLAVDEMVRWVTPVKQFMRTTTEDTEVRGVPIEAGESVLLAYPSANRDDEVFEDPFSFDVGRDPNKHLAFGWGIHHCLGKQLARMEMRALYAELVPRLEFVEAAGEPALMETLFVGGLKHLPIRYKLR